jgi:hypothetical protein
MNKEVKEELFIPKTKHKGLKITLAILLIAGLIVGGYFLYQYKFNSPKQIVSNIINDAKEDFQKKLNETKNSELYKIEGHIKLDSNIDDDTFKILKDLELLFSGEIDSKESISNFNINTKYKNDELATIKAYKEKNVYYILLDGIYDKYLKTENEVDSNLSKININKKDLYTFYISLLNAYEKELENYDIKQENATINIGGKSVNVIDNYLELKDDEVNKLSKGIINTLKNDQNFIEALGNITNSNGKETLDSLIINMDEEEFIGTYRISFYTDKGLLKKKIVSIRQVIYQSSLPVSVNVDKISDEEMRVSIGSMGAEYSVNIKTSNNAINLVLNINILNEYINVTINMSYDTIKEVVKPNITNSKNIDELTDKERQEIEEKLQNNKALLQLIENIQKTNQKEV